MKAKTISALFVLLCLAACSAIPANPPVSTKTAETPESTQGSNSVQTVLKTKIGDLAYVSARFVDEVNGVTPAPGSKLLLVILERPDQTSIDLQSFQDARMQIFIQGDDGTSTLSTMGGWVGKEFAIGFQVPEGVKGYVLAWEDNPPFKVNPIAE